jgi:hypothetical protein
MKINDGRNLRSGRVVAGTGHRGFLLWRTQSGTPVWNAMKDTGSGSARSS